ncbi:MAG: penicillin-binding protein [Blastocatellia bacterium]|jgi:membrane peptidoglycan carboxypeptidase|nr:penicillin-binding protein [Blastocatellia bacterium]
MRPQRLRRNSATSQLRTPAIHSFAPPLGEYSEVRPHEGSVRNAEVAAEEETGTTVERPSGAKADFNSRRRLVFSVLALFLTSLVAWRVVKGAFVWFGLTCAFLAFALICFLLVRWAWRTGWRKIAAILSLASLVATMFFGANVLAVVFDPKIDAALKTRMPSAPQIIFYARQRDGQLTPVFSDGERFATPAEVWESWFSRAAIAIEDERFSTRNEGVVDVRSLLRATLTNLWYLHIKEGGSGIEVQTAKLMLGSFKTEGFIAKVEQYFIAMRLAQRFEEPAARFCIYANIIVLVGESRGVGVAAEDLFGKSDLRSLSIAEGALLAGMLRNPTIYDPRLHPQAALARRNVVLDKMRDLGMITPVQHDAAAKEEIRVLPRTRPQELLARAAVEIHEANERSPK